MKETFFEHYSPTDEEINTIWQDCYFSLDANVLLNLYRYSEATKKDFFKVLEGYRDKLILTYQAGNEYHKNRLSAINGQLKTYDDLIDFFEKKYGEIEAELNRHKKHSFIETEKIKRSFSTSINRVKKDISNLKVNHPNLFSNDPIKEFLTELFEKKITEPYPEDRLASIYKEGKIRYEKQIPPGYKDYPTKKNNDESSLYGDLIIWFQIIDFAKEKGKPIILVTDDLKDDWWSKLNGETKGPRFELLKEFYNKTNQKILIYNPDSFLRFAKDKLGVEIDDTTITEIKDFRLKDESLISRIINFKDSVGEALDNRLYTIQLNDNIQNQKLNLFISLSETDIQYLFKNYFNLDPKRKNIIDLKFDLTCLSPTTNFNNLPADLAIRIKDFITFYKKYGLFNTDTLEIFL